MLVIQLKQIDYDAKMLEIESEYITTAGYNKLTKDIVANKIKNEELVDKSAICGNISNKS